MQLDVGIQNRIREGQHVRREDLDELWRDADADVAVLVAAKARLAATTC